MDDLRAAFFTALGLMVGLDRDLVGHCQVNEKSLPDAFPLRKAEGVGIAKIQGLVKAQNPL
jgi:hypothetical protein